MALFSASTSSKEMRQSSGVEKKFGDVASEENLRERRYFWTARAFAMIFVVSLITNLLMLMSLFSLVPLKRVQPYELTFSDKKAQTVTVRPVELNETLLKGITADMVRQYVTLRKTITSDSDEMAYRWGANGPVDLLSTGNTFQVFAESAQKVMETAVSSQITRDVVIKSAIPYVAVGGGEYWIVDYDLITMSPQNATENVVPYVATVYVTYEPYKNRWENRLKNPIGFKVAQFGDETKESYDAREREKVKNNR